MSLATGKPTNMDRNYPRLGDVVEVTRVVLNDDGSGYLELDWGKGCRHLNFEQAPPNLFKLTRVSLSLTSGTVLLGGGVRARRIADRVSPKRIKFVDTPEDWFDGKWERVL